MILGRMPMQVAPPSPVSATLCLLGSSILALCGAAAIAAEPAADPLELALQGKAFISQTRKTRWGANWSLATGRMTYSLHYRPVSPREPGLQGTKESWLFNWGFAPFGMSGPTSANWYHGGFVNFEVDGVKIHDHIPRFEVAEHAGRQASLCMLWEHPKLHATLTWTVRDGDDRLLLAVETEPQGKCESLSFHLACYPQSFQRPHQRLAVTAKQRAKPGQSLTAGKDEPWILYADEGVCQQKAGDGPCGLLYDPDEVLSVRVANRGYDVLTFVQLPPKKCRFHLALWDFEAVNGAEPNESYLRAHAQAFLADLRAMVKNGWRTTKPCALPPERAKLLPAAGEGEPGPLETLSHELTTPHTPWARPYAGGAVNALVVAPVGTLREVVELAQRLELKYDVVPTAKFGEWLTDEHKGLYGMHYNTRSLSPMRSQLSVYRGLKHKKWDVVVLGNLILNMLKPGVQQALLRAVKQGLGLVYCHSPQRQGRSDVLNALFATATDAAFVTHGVPLQRLPVFDAYGEDAAERVVSAFSVGRGRVLRLNYTQRPPWYETSLTPDTSKLDNTAVEYDYYQALLARAVLWAAKKEPPVRVMRIEPDVATLPRAELGSSKLRVVIENATGTKLATEVAVRLRTRAGSTFGMPAIAATLAPGQTTVACPWPIVPTDRYFVDVLVHSEGKALTWHTGTVTIESTPRVTDLTLDKPGYEPGESVRASFRLEGGAAALSAEIRDSLGRILAQTAIDGASVELPLHAPVTVMHELRVCVMDGNQVASYAAKAFPVRMRRWDDFNYLVWADTSFAYMRTVKNAQLARLGVDSTDVTFITDPDRAPGIMAWRAKQGLLSVPYCASYMGKRFPPGAKSCLSDRAYLRREAERLERFARNCAPYSLLGYTLGDENSLAGGGRCFCGHCNRSFVEWAKRQYGTIAALNREWDTAFESFEEVRPMKLDDAKTANCLPAWVDHRLHQEHVFTRLHRNGADAIRRGDPGARVGPDGVTGSTSWNGISWYQFSHHLDLGQVYLNLDAVEAVRSFYRKGSLLGAWFNDTGWDSEASFRWTPWYLLLHGYNSAWYWTSNSHSFGMLRPDMVPAVWTEWMSEECREIKMGIGKLLLGTERQDDGIAVHYSAAGHHVGTATGSGVWHARRRAWQMLQDLGFQFRFVAAEQIERGLLGNDRYRCLVLANSLALSPKEADAVRGFVENGGRLIVSGTVGAYTAHGRKLAKGLLHDLLPAADLQLRQVAEGQVLRLGKALSGYSSARGKDDGERALDSIRAVLAKMGLTPCIELAEPLRQKVEIARFVDGDALYVGLIDDKMLAVPRKGLRLKLPVAQHLYNVREHRYLGLRTECELQLQTGRAAVIAALPYPPPTVLLGKTRRGAAAHAVSIPVSIKPAKDLPCRHVLRVTVTGPDAIERRHYAQNVVVLEGQGQVEIPFALNDPVGTWRVQIQDVATGASAAVEVER